MSKLMPDPPPYWFVSNPQKRKALYERMFADARKRLEEEYTVVGWDLAKPGSDHTVVFPVYPIQFPSDQYQAITAEYDRLKAEIQRVSAFPPSILVTKEEAARMMPGLEPGIPKQSEPDRIWDMIVLAAESSRYG